MKRFLRPLLSLIILSYLGYLTWFLATGYQIPYPRTHFPVVVVGIDLVDICVHEAGHLFFSPLGYMPQLVGGALMQIMLPLITLLVLLNTSNRTLAFTLYWLGHNLANIAVYIADAPHLRLRMYSFHGLHDWFMVFTQLRLLGSAGDIAKIVLYVGLASCIIGIGIGLYFVILDFSGLWGPESYLPKGNQ
jgi:hypothetical protein